MPYVLRVKLKASTSNFLYGEGRIDRWRYYWENNQIIAYTTIGGGFQREIGGTFRLLQSPLQLDLGLLIDSLTIATNLTISTEINYQLCEGEAGITKDLNDHHKPLLSLVTQLQRLKVLENGQTGDEWPVRIHPGVSIALTDKVMELGIYVLDFFNKKIFNKTELKLLNYWRRGADLEELQYFDESYLAFFKILEYFEQLSRATAAAVPSKYKTQRSQMAYRIAVGAKLKDIEEKNIKYLEHFVEIRDDWDIAHMRVGALPDERDGALYITYYDGFWDLHSDIRELTKLFLLKFLGLGGLETVEDGGLLTIKKITG